MEQEDKELLLKDLYARLPYGVIVQVIKYGKCYDEREKKVTVDCKIVGINRCNLITDKDNVEHTYAKGYVSTPITIPIDDGDMKSLPYLRPMSSMTEEESKEYRKTQITKWVKSVDCTYGGYYEHRDTLKTFDWLLAHHFDYRGLIKRGLAIAVTKENNPYKIAEE